MSFGFVKNGGMNAEALIFFDPAMAPTLAAPQEARRPFAVEGPLPRRANIGDARGRPVAGQCPGGQCRGGGAGRSRRAERLVYPVEANELFVRMTADEAAALGRRAMISTIGVRARCGSSPAGTRTWTRSAARRGDRGAVNRARPSATTRIDASIIIPFIVFTGVWGSTWIVIRDQIGTVPPQWSVAYRFVIAATAMALVAKWKGQSLKIDRGGLIAAWCLASPSSASTSTASIWPSASSPREWWRRCSPLLLIPNSLLAWAFLGQKPNARFLGGLVAVAGVALLFIHELRSIPRATATLRSASASPCRPARRLGRQCLPGRRGGTRHPLLALLAWSMAIGAVIDICLAFAVAGPPVPRRGSAIGRACSTWRCSARCCASASISRWCARSGQARRPIRACWCRSSP